MNMMSVGIPVENPKKTLGHTSVKQGKYSERKEFCLLKAETEMQDWYSG